jgi:hypothetical protein
MGDVFNKLEDNILNHKKCEGIINSGVRNSISDDFVDLFAESVRGVKALGD